MSGYLPAVFSVGRKGESSGGGGGVGETMKYADLELEEPINKERYQVQVKSQAGAEDFRRYCDDFACDSFRRLFFVVHSPDKDLKKELGRENAEIILPERLGRMVVDAGLVGWVLEKIR